MKPAEIRQRLENSSLRGLVPPEFEIIGEEIEFAPGVDDAFWQRWKRDRNWLEAVGVRVYAIPNYRKPKPNEWRARVLVKRLDTLIKCESCKALISPRPGARFCAPCWEKRS